MKRHNGTKQEKKTKRLDGRNCTINKQNNQLTNMEKL